MRENIRTEVIIRLCCELKIRTSGISFRSEKEADEMYRKVSGHVLRLSKGTRSELLSWHTHVRNVNKA